MPTKAREKFRTWGNVFDNFTERTIFKLISEGYFDGLESPISIGKEANIFSATGKNGRVMVKIYRLEACDFNKMYDYIKYDPRYAHIKKRKRVVILHWVQREYRNLLKAREANVVVPTPMKFKNNVLVMEFIGNGEIAPRLKDKKPKNPKEFLKEIIINIKRMYKADMIHADLSAFNILNLNERPVFIDFSQCSSLKHPRAREFLERDIRNICTFFTKLGLKPNEEKIKKQIIKD
ncbi:MAG: RIO1 family regulatory kinase/ATPase [Candidatus Woesearchaeota archaeon]|jgi:RIO kinase 1|nr:RIO1 family regulatory kinase/ATPase [Candidatus Woesearchaeota archaeon]